MPNQLTIRVNNWLDSFLYHPDLSPKELFRKRYNWNTTLIITLCVLAMTILSLFLKLPGLIAFGAVVLFFQVSFLWLNGYVKDFDRHMHYLLVLTILATFFAVIYLGGVVNSFGLTMVGINCLISSVMGGNTRRTLQLFLLYAATIVAAALLQPYLTVPPESTHALNLLYHVLNILWLSCSTLFLIFFFIQEQTRFEQAETNRQKELNEVKTRLYTNITHEFRTPLTIILGMARQIKEQPAKWLDEGLEMIQRNGRQLLQLVNQLLDLRKLEDKAMTLNPVQTDVIAYLVYVVESFHAHAQSKNIDLQYRPEIQTFYMDYDPQKLLNILSNLLSNALKFTPAGGKIEVQTMIVQAGYQEVFRIIVADNGAGIPEEKLPHIFDRFYQADDSATRRAEGTGIGLALTKELVNLMGGAIEANSCEGEGTTLAVELPVTRQAPREAELPNHSLIEDAVGAFALPRTKFAEPGVSPENGSGLPLILIVEDSPDVIRYLHTILYSDYRLSAAGNGREGLELALETIPDLIISDVMMPEMDGFELCRRIKEDFRTSHIPVVLLTARADMESRIEGLERGADAYIAKPFYPRELLTRLKNLIGLRSVLRQRYASLQPPPPSADIGIQAEDAFVQRVRSLMEDHLSEEQFDIFRLCRELAMSRAQLYRKFTALTDIPINKYLQALRLHKARELLHDTRLNVTEVALEAGFKNLSHFSHAFRENFGLSPSEERAGAMEKE